MKKYFKVLLIIFSSLSLTSCFEVVERIVIENDGSGKANFTLNMSQSRTKLNSILRMKTFDGKKVPSKNEIKQKVENIKSIIKNIKGISKLDTMLDFENFIGEVSFDFTNVSKLNEVIKVFQKEGLIKKTFKPDFYSYSAKEKTFKRKNEINSKVMYNELSSNNKKVFEDAKYTSIIKFETTIKSSSNKSAKLSKSKKAIMMKCPVIDIVLGEKSVENTIRLN